MASAVTREQWLNGCVSIARPLMKKVGLELGDVRVAMAPPMSRRERKIGFCFHSEVTADKVREIWISSVHGEPLETAGTLVHELCHAALPDGVGHKRPFVVAARSMLLEGKATATTIGEPFKELWTPKIKKLGPLPGAKFLGLDLAGKPKQKTFEQKNVNCPTCGFAAKVRADQMSWGRLVCPADNEMLLMKCEMMEEGE